MKLTNIRRYGKTQFINPETGRAVNVHTGTRVGYGSNILFYYRSGKRIYINDADFYNNWKSKSNSTENENHI